MRVIRIYRWRCTDRAIEPLARHDVRCAKGPSLLAISLIYSGICWQGKNADTPFATVNPEGQARQSRNQRRPEGTALPNMPPSMKEWRESFASQASGSLNKTSPAKSFPWLNLAVFQTLPPSRLRNHRVQLRQALQRCQFV